MRIHHHTVDDRTDGPRPERPIWPFDGGVAPTGTADLDLITLAHTRIERLITERDTAAAA